MSATYSGPSGWRCPSCGVCHAPWVARCNCTHPLVQAAREIERGQTDPPCMFDSLPPGEYGLVCPCPKCSPRCEVQP